MPTTVDTITDADCCCSGQPCCDGTIPNTLYATFASSCPQWDGVELELIWDGTHWRGRHESADDQCDIEIALTCASEQLELVDFILGDGTSILSNVYETPSCDPVGIVFGGDNLNEEHPCCVGANLDITVTT